MITPLNTSHNRKLNLLDANGKMVAIKNGEVYFYLIINGQIQHYKSEENFFNKNFEQKGEMLLQSFNEEDWETLKKKSKRYI